MGMTLAKMVVERPRNPNNEGDTTALEMLKSIQAGAGGARRGAGTVIPGDQTGPWT